MTTRLLRLAGFLFLAGAASAATKLVYIGTYTNAGSRGIYTAQFDPANGSLSAPVLAAAVADPSFLAFGRDRKFLYAADEHGGTVLAFAVDAASGALAPLNVQPTGGTSAAHLAVDPAGRMLIVANYGSGTVATYPLGSDGRIGPRSSLFEQKGPHGPNPVRQTQSHPHSVVLSPDGRFAFVCDLGLDRVFIYRLDPGKALLEPNNPSFAATPPGSGPRHSVFSADARFYYVVNEMGGSVSTFAYDAESGALTARGTLSSMAPNFSGVRGSAEIALSSDGRWLYASNRGSGRGSDTLAVFSREPQTGVLALTQIFPSGGRMPRNFALSPDGRWLLAANQMTDNVVVFALEQAGGKILHRGGEIAISRPVCLLCQP